MIKLNNIYKKIIDNILENYFSFLFVVLIIVNIFMFRDAVLNSYESWNGNSFISREELVPIFNIKSQFIDQMSAEESLLTSAPEIRVSYSALTAWTRYYSILPITLVLMSTVSIFILIYSFFYFCHNTLKISRKNSISASLYPGISIGFIILYSKIAHFYTLVFGFSLFALAIVLTLDLFLRKERATFKNLLYIALLILLNPAIHFHILYYITSVFILTVIIITKKIFYKIPLISNKGRIWGFLILIILSAVPYALFLMKITSSLSQKITDSIPIDYWIIYYSSLPLKYLLALNMPGHVDSINYGSYITPQIKYSGAVLTILSVLSIFFANKGDDIKNNRVIKITFLVTFLISIFMSLGYSNAFSMHSIMAYIINILPESGSTITTIIKKIFFMFLQVLRYPHRFEFILFVLVGLMSTFTISGMYSYFNIFKKYSILKIILPFILIITFFSNKDYYSALTSGNFNTFISPFVIPNELKEIKKQMEILPEGKMIVLPSLESGRSLYTGESTTSFIDKTLIYYIDKPSLYYGAGSDIKNKIMAINVYTSINNDEDSWDTLLYSNMEIGYILVPRTVFRSPGQVYLPGVEKKIDSALKKSKLYKKIYDGSNFDLYQANTMPKNNKKPLLISVSDISKYISSYKLNDSKIFLPFQIEEYLESVKKNGYGDMVTDRLENLEVDLLANTTLKKILPDEKKLPFSKKTSNSSFYLSNTFSFFTLFDEKNIFNHFRDVPTSTINILNPYFYQPSEDTLYFDINTGNDSLSNIYFRGVHLDQSDLSLDNNINITVKRIEENNTLSESEYQYFKSEEILTLKKGKHEISIKKRPDSKSYPIIEYVIINPTDLNKNFSIIKKGVNSYFFQIQN